MRAFGDKKRLFLEAVNRYAGDPATMAERIACAATAYDAARDMLLDAATAFTGKRTPKGCLLASATASGSSDCADREAPSTRYAAFTHPEFRAKLSVYPSSAVASPHLFR
jgi:AcrR family transcriptional regulator